MSSTHAVSALWSRLTRQGGQMISQTLRQTSLSLFPLRDHLRSYSGKKFVADTRAAVQVAMLDLPQGIAYASLAGLPLQFGTMCSAVAATLGAVFGSSRLNVIGPTNATAFMVFSYFATHPSEDRLFAMPVLVLMTGLLLTLGAVLRVAELTQYVSRTVLVAYVTGAAALIIANQLPQVLGITLASDGGTQPRTLPGILWCLVSESGHLRWSCVAAAALTAAVYLTMKKVRPRWPCFAVALFFVSTLHTLAKGWDFAVPTYADAIFSWRDLIPSHAAFASSRLFSLFNELFGLSLAVGFLSMLEAVSMSKALSSRADVNQDMLGLGVANLGCAWFSGMPCSGSLTRSALNHQCGAQTPVAAMLNGLLCLVGALSLGPLVGLMPRAALSALIICVAVSLMQPRSIIVCLSATGSDALTFLVTLAATLLVPLHVAIFVGVGVSLLLYLRKASRPMLVEYEFNQDGHLAEAVQPGQRRHPAISIVHVEGELFFGAAELFRTQVRSVSADPQVQVVILRMKNARNLDATCVLALESLVGALRREGRHILVSGVSKDIYRVLRDSGLADIIGRDRIFPTSPSNPNLATRNALKRAQGILGTSDAEVKIFVRPFQPSSPG